MTNPLKRELYGELQRNNYGDQFGLESRMIVSRQEEARIIVSRQIRDKLKAIAKKNNLTMAAVVLLGARALEKRDG